ncbi:MAG: HAMP domain-containing histidine kinase [Candidatus Hydrogenedentes bacterium]|nr:HAMP domain-containing histidine kinase [Candidatus Hydrogenedentota bacterium]
MAKTRPLRTLAFRLTLIYAFAGLLALVLVLVGCYLVLKSMLQRELDEHLVSEIVEYGALLKEQNLDILRDVLEQEAYSEGVDRIFFRVFDASGKEVIGTDVRGWTGLSAQPPALLVAMHGQTVFETLPGTETTFPARIVYGLMTPSLVLQVGASTESTALILRQFRRIFVAAMFSFFLCSIILGAVIARRALAGLRETTNTARAIIAGAWLSRVPVSPRGDEIDELALTFNRMIDRIQVLMQEMREVTDDIAHDLRTPLTRMRAQAEEVLDCPSASSGERELAGGLLEEADGLLGLINTMLEISQTEAGVKEVRRERVEMGEVAQEVCELFAPAAEDKEVSLTCERVSALPVKGDAQKLRRALAHIVDNAVKYTPAGGSVMVSCQTRNGMAVIAVRDTGIGIGAADLDKIFTRFYRVDQSRSQSGNGLGLSLARAVCHAHGGEITVQSELKRGSTFEMSIPAA